MGTVLKRNRHFRSDKKIRFGVCEDLDYILDDLNNIDIDNIGYGYKYEKTIGEFKTKTRLGKLLMFKKSLNCAICNLKGEYFAIEKSIPEEGGHYHLSLYGINQKGEHIIFTKDHIIPKSKGGINDLSNYNTCCYQCNQMKRNKLNFKGGK